LKLKIIPYEILIFNDEPQLFLAKDQVGLKYLCLAIKPENEYLPEYIAVPVSNNKLDALKAKKIDLRSAFQESEIGVWYHLFSSDNEEFIISPFQFDVVEEKYLPLEGFYFPKS